MQFQTAEFIVFFCVCFFAYYSMFAGKKQWIWLLIISYAYYALWGIEYLPFLMLTTIISYGLGLFIDKIENLKLRKALLVLGSIYSVAYLGIFKYFDFITASICEMLKVPQRELNLIVPIGISFYTFQTLGYLIDVYRKEVEAEKNIFKYALEIAFFPHIVSGPIGRIKELKKELFTVHKYEHKKFISGSVIFLIGMFMKLVIADRIAIFVNGVYDKWVIYGGSILFVTSLFYTFQIYCDFAGYSYMALGLAKILGIDIINNFDRPYFSKSIKEFWGRWHKSLSMWFRDYLYIPLGGNRRGRVRADINRLFVFTVSGLWHGANWTFVIWGALHGVYQILGDKTKKIRERWYNILGLEKEERSRKYISVLCTFLLVNFAWIFFRAEDISMAFGIITRIFTDGDIWSLVDGTLYTVGLDQKEIMVLLIALIAIWKIELHGDVESLAHRVSESHIIIRWGFIYLLIIGIMIFGVYGIGYNATNFIYSNF